MCSEALQVRRDHTFSICTWFGRNGKIVGNLCRRPIFNMTQRGALDDRKGFTKHGKDVTRRIFPLNANKISRICEWLIKHFALLGAIGADSEDSRNRHERLSLKESQKFCATQLALKLLHSCGCFAGIFTLFLAAPRRKNDGSES